MEDELRKTIEERRDEMTAGPTEGYQDMDKAADTFQREAQQHPDFQSGRSEVVDVPENEQLDRSVATETDSY